MRRAVFLDRDGVLVRVRQHDEYAWGPLTLDEFSLLPNIAEPVERIRQAGLLAVLVTNQPGISRGTVSWETMHEMHQRLQSAVTFDDIQVCPHIDEDECECRKPKPGMLLQAAQNLSIDMPASFLVGDTNKDLRAASAAGVKFILIDAPYNRDLNATRAADLAQAVDLILAM
jgi:D-glycero-D-manno-heptose 1,7-bisphosphate phosphatase